MERRSLAETGFLLNVSANTTISPPARGILVNGASTTALINVTLQNGTTLLLPLAVGMVHPLEVKAVSNVNTTATGAWYFR